MDSLKSLGLDLPADKCKLLMAYVDKDDSGTIDVEEFVNSVYESIPSSNLLI